MSTNSNTSAAPAETPVPAPGGASGPAQAVRRRLAKVAISFVDRVPDLVLLAMIARIIEAMTGNASYPDPVPSLAALAAARRLFEVAVLGNNRTRPAIVRRDNARQALGVLVRDLALYVQHTCQGDLQVLLSSGYPAQRGRGAPAGVLPAPVEVRARAAALGGQVIARCRRDPAAVSYQWRYATVAAPDAWILVDPVVRASVTLVGLTRGTDYVLQVRAIGSKGPGAWSDAVRVVSL